MAESDKVINAVMETTGESYEKVSTFTAVAHETVDECLTDDISVVAPPLVIGRLGCPVLDRLLLRLIESHQAAAPFPPGAAAAPSSPPVASAVRSRAVPRTRAQARR